MEFTERNDDINQEFCTEIVTPTDAPPARIVIPSDVIEIQDSDESVYVIGTREGKVTKIDGLDHLNSLKMLILRSCLVSKIERVESLVLLTKLELYDNQIEEITGIETLVNLKILDLSFNAIRTIENVTQCPQLEELYVAQNKLRKIEGIEGLPCLKILDLGANRIRVIEGLDSNTALQELWLGKNKIETIDGLQNLQFLEKLDIQSNRLTSLGSGLSTLGKLVELYLGCNQIENLDGLPVFDRATLSESAPATNSADLSLLNNTLTTIDLSNNKLSSVAGVEAMTVLEDFWITKSLLESFEALAPLSRLQKLTTLYLEHSPIAKDFEYRKTVSALIPTLEQLDATLVRRET